MNSRVFLFWYHVFYVIIVLLHHFVILFFSGSPGNLEYNLSWLLYLAMWMAMGKLDFLKVEIFLLESLKLTRHMESIKWLSSENMVRSQDKLYSRFPGDPEKNNITKWCKSTIMTGPLKTKTDIPIFVWCKYKLSQVNITGS
jgi:hypothetical protein